jgi:hypothetical protein
MHAIYRALLLFAAALTVAHMACTCYGEPITRAPWSAQRTKTYFDDLNDLNPDQGWDKAFQQFQIEYGDGPYDVDAVRNFKPISKHPVAESGSAETKQGFQGLKIRSNYDDVLTSEDPTIASPKENKADLTGASFSYTRDFRTVSDSWAAIGAIIAPFTWSFPTHPHTAGPLELQNAGLIPSVSFDRESNTNDSSKEVDSLTFRLGVFAKVVGGPIYSQTLRAFATYGTDFEFKSQIPSAQVEYEPAFIVNRDVGVGTVHALFPRMHEGENPSTAPKTILAYRLRTYLHAEYGSITDKGDLTTVKEEDFLRVGPVLQLRVAPLFTDKLNCTVSYEYFANVVGHTSRNYLFKVEPSYDISDAVSLKASYADGGVNLTDQPVHTFFIGLGVTR